MDIKLWIDDVRTPPDSTWDWVTTSAAAIAFLELMLDGGVDEWLRLEHVSFDHDLGGDDTSRPVVLWMIENNIRFRRYSVHSANPVGKEWLSSTIQRYLM